MTTFKRVNIVPPLVICDQAPSEGHVTLVTEYANCPYCGRLLLEHKMVLPAVPPPLEIGRFERSTSDGEILGPGGSDLEKRTGRDRIQREDHADESALANMMGDQMAEDAWPGVFSGGKRIVATQVQRNGDQKILRLRFNDGSEMNIAYTQIFYKRAVGQQPFDDDFGSGNPEVEVEVEVTAIEAGRQLMSGEDVEE